jgi:hypothetical protein
MGLRRLLIGQPFRSDRLSHALLPKRIALPVFASDAMSSVAYAPEEIFLVLSVAGLSAYVMAPRIVAAVPASESAVQAYVEGVDRARLGVDAALQSASRSLRSLSGVDGEGG